MEILVILKAFIQMHLIILALFLIENVTVLNTSLEIQGSTIL